MLARAGLRAGPGLGLLQVGPGEVSEGRQGGEGALGFRGRGLLRKAGEGDLGWGSPVREGSGLRGAGLRVLVSGLWGTAGVVGARLGGTRQG